MHLTKGPLDLILENNWLNFDRAGRAETRHQVALPYQGRLVGRHKD
jgi:hypothetical protein